MDFTPRLIHGTGPVPCRLLLVGEAGGYDEHRLQQPFVGKAGMVLTTYLTAAGIRRSTEAHVDNLYPYWTGPGNPPPDEGQTEAGGRLLRKTIRRVDPDVIGCLGAVPSRWFLPWVEMKRDHGLGFEVELEGRARVVVPCYHPAAGFYNPSAAALCQQDLAAVKGALQGKGVWRETPSPRSNLVAFPHAHSADVVPRDGDALDTEGSIGRPWGLSWSAGHGQYVARVAKVRPLLPRRLTMHYALHDLSVLRAMGADTNEVEVDDTIVMAFDLMGGGQDNSGEDRGTPFSLSLKALAYRELGIRMQDFVDLVRPYYNKRVEEWIDALVDKELPAKSEPELREVKGEWKIYTPHPPRRRYLAVLKEAAIGGRPEKVWSDLPGSMRKLGEERMGERFPSLSTAIELVPEKEAVQYAGCDAWATRELEIRYRQRLREKGLEQVYEIDRKALRFVDLFVQAGMPVDMGETRRLREELEERTDGIKSAMRRLTGMRRFNPGSRDDVARYLYGVHGLSAPRLTEGGEDSTDKKSVQILRQRVKTGEVAEFLDQLLEYRECQKYIGTYLDYMIEKSVETSRGWRLFPDDISTTRVVSGRLSGRLLTFPTRSDLGSRIRKCFVAGEGKRVLSVDLSQIELRMMAEMSGDETMLAAFRQGKDLHALTGERLFRVREVSKAQRYISKTLNFAILYGISARALLEQLAVAGIYDYARPDCKRFISDWFALYPGVKEYLDALCSEAARTGEVRDWAGRLRYVPNIRLPKGPLQEKARRDVGNFPIQAGARELVKIAEGDMVPWLRSVRGMLDPILDIHDEVLFEVDEDVVEEAGEIVKGFMLDGGRKRFGVPLEAGVSWGRSWGEAK